MSRIARILTLLAVSTLAITGCSSGFEPGTTGAEQAITNVCSGPSAYVYPWNATYPLGTQHVFCNHQPADFQQQYWPPNVSACTGNPNGQQVPSAGQVDVWVMDIATPRTYRCGRVTVPSVGHYSLTYWELLNMGWRATGYDQVHTRKIQGILVGPGVQWMMSSDSDVYVHGCPASPASACATGVNWLDSHETPWVQIDGVYDPMLSLNFQPVGCSYPSCD